MSHFFHDTKYTVDVLERPLGWAAGLLADARERLVLARTRKVVRALSDAQRADAGIDASVVLPPRPTITVEAGLMRRLMEMR